jgi:hypothetical protein
MSTLVMPPKAEGGAGRQAGTTALDVNAMTTERRLHLPLRFIRGEVPRLRVITGTEKSADTTPTEDILRDMINHLDHHTIDQSIRRPHKGVVASALSCKGVRLE